MEIAINKKVNIIRVKANDKITFDKKSYFEVLYPTKKLEHDDINNNSIVGRFVCNGIKILFTRSYRRDCRKIHIEII